MYNAGFAWDMDGIAFTSAWETVCVQLFPDGVVGSALDAADVALDITHDGADVLVTLPSVPAWTGGYVFFGQLLADVSQQHADAL